MEGDDRRRLDRLPGSAFVDESPPHPSPIAHSTIASAPELDSWVASCTRVGDDRLSAVPSPICPFSLWPQQYATPSRDSAHAVALPTDTCTKLSPPITGMVLTVGVVLPLPSSPNDASP